FSAVRPLDLPAREIDTFKGDGLAFLLTPSRHFNNWYYAIYPLGLALFAGVVGLGGLAYQYSRQRHWQILDWQQIGLLVLYSFLGIGMSASFTQVWLGAGKIRHVLPISLALIPLWAAALVQISWAIRDWLEKSRQRHWQRLPVAVTAAVASILAVSFVPGNGALLKQYELTPMPVLLWRWTDANVPLEGLIMTPMGSDIANTWNRPWSGYDGVKSFQWWQEPDGDILKNTPEQLVERNIRYFALSDKDRADLYGGRLNELDAFLRQFTLIKTIPAHENIMGSTVYFYRVAAPQIPAQTVFGGQIQLIGYDLNTPELKAGNILKFRPYWRIQRQPATNYSLFVHLYPAAADQLIVQNDGPPTSLDRLTLTWDDPQEVYIGADVSLPLPADLAPGPYRLVLGLYDFSTGQRLTTEADQDSFSIPIEIPKN
ncbi:MAG TPA: hypothetical protein VHO69_00365, partial [Phototrophicaceae bacterium]|nr:hypothetical protein [Phototrophicaceae bacterium]